MARIMKCSFCIFILLILISASAYANQADSSASIKKQESVEAVIRVIDKEGNPASGALVLLKKSGWSEIGSTDSKGEIKVTLVPKSYKFMVKYGDETIAKTHHVKKKIENIVIFTLKSSIVPEPTVSFDFDSTIDGWSVGAWSPSGFSANWEPDSGINGSKCLSIDASTPNDISWSKELATLNPGKTYLLSGYIKGEGIVNHDGGSVGANLCIIDTWDLSGNMNDSQGTFDWKRFEVQFAVPSDGIVKIGCRLGFNSNLTSGKVFFDNLSITPLAMNTVEGTHVQITLESSDSSTISAQSYARWIDHLDDSYEGYLDLVGLEPYPGEKVKIYSTRNYPGGWAVAGNPILWHQWYVKDELGRIASNDDWSFGILHEIGHLFDLEGRWNWDGEFWANMKMCYIVETLGAKVRPAYDGAYYTGSEIENYYKTDSNGYDSLTYSFLKIKNQIGWEPFKLTFRYFNSLNQADVPQSRLDKFNLFMNKLDDFSNPRFDSRSVFSPEQLSSIESYLQN